MNWQLVLLAVGLILVLIGVILIYDARIITKKLFSFGDQNEGTLGMKIVGVIVMIIGSVIIILN